MALYQGFNDLEKLGLTQILSRDTAAPSSHTLLDIACSYARVGDNER